MSEQDDAVERWDGSAGRYTDEQYARACVLDRNDCEDASNMTAKQRYSLPVANPGSSWSQNPDRGGVAAAAQRLGQVNAGAACKTAASRRLRSCYSKLGMTAPDSLSGGQASAPPPKEGLLRFAPVAMSYREDGGDSLGLLEGHFVRFDEWTEIDSVFEGHFMEKFAPGAFAKTFAEHRDQIRVLFQHGRDPTIGDKPLGPIRSLEEDGYGAAYEVPLIDTSYNRDLLEGLRHGLYGSSFKFSITRDEFTKRPARSDLNPDGIPERRVTEAKIYEFGPVTWPQYASSTAGVRSLTDEYLLRLFDAADPEQLRQKIDYVRDGSEEPEQPPAPADAPPQTTPSIFTSSLGAAFHSRYTLTPKTERPSWLL
jgi:HK97 family phage prohead protease